MVIRVNGKEMDLDTPATLLQLMQQLHLEQKKGIAVAVNQQVVPAAGREQHLLQENDQVLIIQAAQGG